MRHVAPLPPLEGAQAVLLRRLRGADACVVVHPDQAVDGFAGVAEAAIPVQVSHKLEREHNPGASVPLAYVREWHESPACRGASVVNDG